MGRGGAARGGEEQGWGTPVPGALERVVSQGPRSPPFTESSVQTVAGSAQILLASARAGVRPLPRAMLLVP